MLPHHKHFWNYLQNQFTSCTIALLVKNPPAMQETLVWFLGWRKEWLPTPVFLLGEVHGRRSLVGCSPWSCKASDVTKWLSTAQRGVRVLTEVNSSAMSFSGPPLLFLRPAQQVKGCMFLLCSLESLITRQAKGTVCRLLRNVPKAWIHFPHLLQGSL